MITMEIGSGDGVHCCLSVMIVPPGVDKLGFKKTLRSGFNQVVSLQSKGLFKRQCENAYIAISLEKNAYI